MTKTNVNLTTVLEVVANLKGQATVTRVAPRNEKGHYCGPAKTIVTVEGHPVRDQWARQYLKNKLGAAATMQRTQRGSGRTEFVVA